MNSNPPKVGDILLSICGHDMIIHTVLGFSWVISGGFAIFYYIAFDNNRSAGYDYFKFLLFRVRLFFAIFSLITLVGIGHVFYAH